MRCARIQHAALAGAQWCAIALGFSIPISAAMDSVLLALFLMLWLASGDLAGKAHAIRINPVALAALSVALVVVVGMTWSSAAPSRLGHSAVDPLRFVLLAALATAFVDARTRRRAELAFLAASALTLVLSFVLWSGLVDSIPGTKGRPDYPVVFKYHITHNVLMAVAALLFALNALGAERRAYKFVLWLLAAAATANVFLLIPGRTGQLALAAAIIYLGLARLRWRGLAAAGTALAVLGAVAWFTPNTVLHERAEKAWREAQAWKPGEAQAETSSVGLRLEFYRNSIQMIAERPLFGTGSGGFRSAYEAQVKGSGMVVTDHPHNAFLHIGVELGVLGLGVLLALLIVQWHSAGAMDQFRERAAARGLIVIFIVAGMVSSTFSDHAEGLFFSWASALLFAGAQRTLRQ